MNATTTIESTALSLPERAAVAMRTSACEISLLELVSNASGITTVTNADGRAESHRALMNHVAARTGIDKDAASAVSDAKGFIGAVGDEKKRLTDIIKPSEDRLRGLRDGFDEVEASAKAAKIHAEIERIKALRDMMAIIRQQPLATVGRSSAEIGVMIADLVAVSVGTEFQEFQAEAVAAKAEALELMAKSEVAQRAIEVDAESRRQEAARLKAQQEEEAAAAAAKMAADREELRLLQEAQRKQAAELAEAKRVQNAIEQERIDAQAAAVAAFRAEQAAHAAKVQRQADALAAQQAAADARNAEAARQAMIDAAHGEGLELNAQWDADELAMGDDLQPQIDADHEDALELNAAHDAARINEAHAEALHFNAIFNGEHEEYMRSLDAATVPALDVATLADSAGEEPATDAEIIAELLAALIGCTEAMEDIDGASYSMTLAMINASRVIARVEGRAA